MSSANTKADNRSAMGGKLESVSLAWRGVARSTLLQTLTVSDRNFRQLAACVGWDAIISRQHFSCPPEKWSGHETSC